MSDMMKTRISKPSSLPRRVLPSLVAFVATMLALPIQAVTFPGVPLQSGASFPPPNIMFILDDSGSMAWDFMPGGFGPSEVPTTAPLNIGLRTPSRNTLYYNPATTYRPWLQSDGTRLTGGTSFNAAFADDNLPQTPVDLDTLNETFYVLKSGGVAGNTADYTRYRFLAAGTVEQAQYSAGTTTSLLSQSGLTKTGGTWTYFGPYVTTGATNRFVVTTSGGTGDGDLYVRRGANPTGSSYDCASTGNTTAETCDIPDPVAGSYYVGYYAYSNIANVTINVQSASGYWTTSVALATPTGRTAAAERTNFATWYSYDRTRIKMAKAGASEAFGQLGSNLRVGFDTIWNRNRFPIPVGTSNGLFTSTNRDTWYSRLQAASASNGTPLKGALQRNGEYFTDVSASGPWGPETGSSQISCRQNFSILTTDGYWNSDSGYTAPVGDEDGTAGPTITGPNAAGPTGATFTYNVTRPYADNFPTTPATQPDTLADVAMHYWKRDLVPSLTNNVPTSVADPAFWQHMVTFSVSIGEQGTLNPATDLPSIINATANWPDPTPTENTTRIDDLWHAAVNGRGTFVAAKNPQLFAQGLVNALTTVASRLGSSSNVTANSTSFSSTTRVYQASYVTGQWTGELAAYDASAAGVAAIPAWKASTLIPPTASRKIFIWNATTGAAFPSALTAAQATALTRVGGTAPVTGALNAAYIAGDTTGEKRNNGTLRDRASRLGDIAYSSPMYVKDSETIFVGANDGMLHAFAAVDRPSPSTIKGGTELFAYIPGGINLADLSTLSDPQYTHKYFVDGPIAVSTLKQTPGKNYLVGALGRGGKGVFGLDVTTPGSFGAGNALWEQNSGVDMGQVLGEPLIVTLNNGQKGVLVSNGLNSTSRTAALFILNLATGAVIKELNTNVGNAGNENGLFAPRGWDEDGDGVVDDVYAGDFKGNVWKFDLRGTTTGSWNVAFGGSPMFTTKSGQPITTGLGIARDLSTLKRWIFVGTGSFLQATDATNTTVQSMYGIIDNGTNTAVGLSDLVKRNILVTGTDSATSRAIRGFEANAPLTAGTLGWYIDLDQPTPGERIVSNPRVRGTMLLTASIIPPSSTDICDVGGTGYINALDAFTGTSLRQPFFDSNGSGKVTGADVITSGSTTVPVGSLDLGVGMPTLPTVISKLLVVGGSKGTLGSVVVNPQDGSNQRISWHEILRD